MTIATFLEREKKVKVKAQNKALESVKPYLMKKAFKNGLKISFSSTPKENEIPLAGLLREGFVTY